MSYEQYLSVVERSIADTIAQFSETPDLYLREGDLLAAFFHTLQQHEILVAPHATRDGRLTSLVHREMPTFFAYPVGAWHAMPILDIEEQVCQSYYDVAVLHPGFVRSHDLEVVANNHAARVSALRALPDDERPVPFLAVIDLKLIERFSTQMMDELETDFYDLVRAEPDAVRRYLAIFCRQWDLAGPMDHVVQTVERWARTYASVSVVFVQAYRDNAGRVFGGRYLNLWNHTAALPPLMLKTGILDL